VRLEYSMQKVLDATAPQNNEERLVEGGVLQQKRVVLLN
jgi:hypothetical protein